MIYDVLIVGGGPIGIACALEAKRKNLSYIIIEKGALVNSLYHYPDKMSFFSTSEKLELSEIPFVSNNTKPTKQEALEYYRRIVDSKQIHIHLFENVESISKKENLFYTTTKKSTYQSKHIVIATGFYDIPNYLNIPGENLDKVTHYYGDPHYYATQNVVVVGASNSSVDAALETYRKGANVTMIIRGDDIGKRVKYWVRPDIKNRIEEGSITAYFNSELTEIGEDYVKFKDETGSIHRLDNDFVLALTGYRPNFKFLEKLGINLSKDGLNIPTYNPQTMETNVKGIYLAGVICGGMETHKWFIENSRVHAKLIANHITKTP
jgi:putative YpdA family bacillithiol system oxidoreductase